MRTRRVTIALLASILFAPHAIAQGRRPTNDWPAAIPASVGLDPAPLVALDGDIAAGKHGYVDSMLVIRQGKAVYERSYRHDYDRIYGELAKIKGPLNPDPKGQFNYYNPDWHPFYRRGDLHTLQSVTKTVTSILIGIAVTRKEFTDLDTPVLKFFDLSKVANVDERKRRLTLRHLLTMTAGLEWNEDLPYSDPNNTAMQMEASDDWVTFAINRPMAHEPGAVFAYSSGASELLSHVFKEVTGEHIDEYARKHLFGPLGITRYYWKRTPNGLADTEGGLYLRPQDLAKIGYLYLRNGLWNGRRLLQADWISASVTPAVSEARDGMKYGFKWWLLPYAAAPDRLAWFASGLGGQRLVVVPEYDLVVVFTGWNIDPNRPRNIREALEPVLRAAGHKVPAGWTQASLPLQFTQPVRASGQPAARQEAKPIPRTSVEGRALEFDFPDLHIGIAEYEEGPTGTTVFYFPKKVMAVVDVRGGAPGTTYTDGLRLGYGDRWVDAISFAGGSAYGLEAAAGASAEIRAMRENAGDWGNIVIVPGAIIFDLAPRRFNTIYPDQELGRAAVRAAGPGRFPLGAHGAGRFATQGSYFGDFEYRQYSGQGGAFRQAGPTKIAVFTVVNPVGAVVDRQGNVVRCPVRVDSRGCGPITDYLRNALERKLTASTSPLSPVHARPEPAGLTNNTTITLVVTNQKLDYWELQRLAVQVHTSMARAIQPFHTQRDGDTLFAVTTSEVENPSLQSADLGVLASEVAWDAVLSSVPPLESAGGKVVEIDTKFYDSYIGRYEFGPGVVLTVTREGNRLFAEATGKSDVYSFRLKRKEELFPTSDTDFLSRNRRGDRLRFEKDVKNGAIALTLNPGRWGLPARKIQ